MATTDTHLFDISTNKAKKISLKITFKSIHLQGKEL